MLKEKEKIISQVHRLVDLCLTVGVFILAYYIRTNLPTEYFRPLKPTSDYKVVVFMIIIIWYIVFERFHLYSLYNKHNLTLTFFQVVKAVSTGMLLMILGLYIFRITTMSRLIIGFFYILNISVIYLSKSLVYRILDRLQQIEFNIRKVLIIGSKKRAQDVIYSIYKSRHAGVFILGCLEINPADIGKKVSNDIEVIGTINNIEKIILRNVVDELIFAMPLRNIENIDSYISLAEVMGISVRVIPDFQIHHLMKQPGMGVLKMEEFNGILTLSLHTTPANYGRLFIKSAIDIIFAAACLIIFLPLFCVISIAIKCSSPGPVLFKQERCGLNGRRFELYKFRTMLVNAEDQKNKIETMNEAEDPVFKIKNDPRIIPFIGKFLRKNSLDELPQLINVLKGEMSLVGPRPPLPEEVFGYKLWQRRRLSMKPGMTCLWQVKQTRYEISFQEWINMDLKYIDNWSILLDFKILLATLKTIVIGGGR
jgi:exopolysaccharide biosynthesis polyprenyl glycosylphosphotransferase